MNIIAAIQCASLLSGYPIVSDNYPPVYERFPNQIEREHSRMDALGVFMKYKGVNEVYIVAPSWDILVHESVHWLQWTNGVPFLELHTSNYEYIANKVQFRAWECPQ